MSLTNTIANAISNPNYTNILSSINTVSGGVGSVLSKLNSDDKDKKDSTAIRDLNLNGFLSQNSTYFKPTYFARAFDEPTYLTFRVEFIFNDTMRNTAYNNYGLFNPHDDVETYATMYDYLPEPFLESPKTVNQSVTKYDMIASQVEVGVDSSIGRTYSTEYYLDHILGDHGRSTMLHTFKDALRDIQNVFPYYMTSISGLHELMKVDSLQGIRLKNAKIEISCMEGLDLKITQLMNLYRKIVWDDIYQRWVLPDMMRYFGMKIYISEIRMFHDMRHNKTPKDEYVYDFTSPDVKNATHSPNKANSGAFEKFKNAAKTGAALSSTYLGSKSHLTKAINIVDSATQTISDVKSDIMGAFRDIDMCNNALNDVMPTICLECHMCEFDISDTMTHLGTLKSSKPQPPEPKIKINVGQVKETHVYPLNTSLRSNNGKYLTTIPEHATITGFDIDKYNGWEWTGDRDASTNILTYLGNYISDNALKGKYRNTKPGNRLHEYATHLQDEIGLQRSGTILAQRYPTVVIDNLDKMTKSRSASSQELTNMSLTSAGIQEATSILQYFDGLVDPNGKADLEYIYGTHSTATSPDRSTRKSVQAVGDMLKQALDKIYNGEEIQSMALSDEMKNKISSELFKKYITTLEEEAEQDSILKEILKQYRIIESETDYISTATKLKDQKFNELN